MIVVVHVEQDQYYMYMYNIIFQVSAFGVPHVPSHHQSHTHYGHEGKHKKHKHHKEHKHKEHKHKEHKHKNKIKLKKDKVIFRVSALSCYYAE